MTEKKPEVTGDSYSIILYYATELPESYRALVFSKWLRSLRYGNKLFKKIDADDYYRQYHHYLEKLLSKPDAIIRLAVLTDDKDVVLGFSVSREDVLDYIYTHKDHRKIGIGKSLMPPKITTFTHITETVIQILKPLPAEQLFAFKDYRMKFNPFA